MQFFRRKVLCLRGDGGTQQDAKRKDSFHARPSNADVMFATPGTRSETASRVMPNHVLCDTYGARSTIAG
jgi:hypothetical protein